MSNLLNNQFHNLRLEINESEYWDFFINRDGNIHDIDYTMLGNSLADKCLSSFIDLSNSLCVSGTTIVSLPDYTWENAVNNMPVLENIGYTGLDNGLIPFKRDEITNKEFPNIFQNSVFYTNGTNQLFLYPVETNSKKYDYPYYFEENRVKLDGGFFQGFFETECDKYQILPDRLDVNESWELEFVLEKKDFDFNDKTLNHKHPNNKGIFFYIGTRAENKWALLYSDIDKDDCDVYFSEDYVDDKDTLDPNDTFLDMSYEVYDWEQDAMDDYNSFKYYNDSLYNVEEHGLEDFFYETHKANIIDENCPNEIIDCWCNDICKEVIKIKKNSGCGCGGGTFTTRVVEKKCDGFVSKCSFFDLVDNNHIFDENIDYIESEIDISDFEYETANGFNLKINGQWYKDYTNPFLLFDRTCKGYTANTYKEGDVVRYIGVNYQPKENPFLWYNRTCTGHTAANDTEGDVYQDYNMERDLYQNALAFRITDDGRIGYRYLVQSCDNEIGYEIKEGYSNPEIIKEGEIVTIHVSIKSFVTTMCFEFYVNGKLVFLTNELPKLNLKALKDLYEKQEGVPFNISLGGGTQGLLETVLPKYWEMIKKVYPIEENFAGTFIGYLYAFRFYTCKMNFFDILNNYHYELKTKKYLFNKNN